MGASWGAQLGLTLRVGIDWIEIQHMIEAVSPFGGVTQSGWGRELGLPGIEACIGLKSVPVSLI